uniref:Uncharacterized protein n=1 Tax=Geospiza parvula TaxID=87175 RepID=A0A8U8B5F9_GEOPR
MCLVYCWILPSCGKLLLSQWSHDTLGHQGRDAAYRDIIHGCEKCTYEDAWQIDYITLLPSGNQTGLDHSKIYIL